MIEAQAFNGNYAVFYLKSFPHHMADRAASISVSISSGLHILMPQSAESRQNYNGRFSQLVAPYVYSPTLVFSCWLPSWYHSEMVQMYLLTILKVYGIMTRLGFKPVTSWSCGRHPNSLGHTVILALSIIVPLCSTKLQLILKHFK